MELHIYKDADALSVAVADWMATLIYTKLQGQQRFTLALSGGSTPQKLHKILASSPYKEKIDWTKLHIFWGDERYVPLTDERSNAKMAFDTLLNHVPVPAENIHIMRTDISPEASAVEYEKILHSYFGEEGTASSIATFDLLLLGMGDDGHTLSLFPGTTMVNEKATWCSSFFLQQQDMYRITITQTAANLSKHIAFLTTGGGKTAALQQVLQGAFNPNLYPSQLIKPVNGQLHWFVDEAAAAKL